MNRFCKILFVAALSIASSLNANILEEIRRYVQDNNRTVVAATVALAAIIAQRVHYYRTKDILQDEPVAADNEPTHDADTTKDSLPDEPVAAEKEPEQYRPAPFLSVSGSTSERLLSPNAPPAAELVLQQLHLDEELTSATFANPLTQFPRSNSSGTIVFHSDVVEEEAEADAPEATVVSKNKKPHRKMNSKQRRRAKAS